MDIRNTTLDDIAAEIGFSATLRLVAWFGDDGNMYVPTTVDERQLLPTLIGMSAATALSKRWPGEYLNVPRLTDYEIDTRRGAIAKMLEAGLTTRYISHVLRISERRVQQMCREMEVVGLIRPVGPPREKTPGKDPVLENWLQKTAAKKGVKNGT